MLNVTLHIFLCILFILKQMIHFARVRVRELSLFQFPNSIVINDASRKNTVAYIEIIPGVIAPECRTPAVLAIIVIQGEVEHVACSTFEAFIRIAIFGIEEGIAELDAEIA